MFSVNRGDVRGSNRPPTPVIGIDFGTSKTCAAICRNEKVSIVINERGDRVTPCYAEFATDSCNIGESARKNAFRNPENTVYGIKRLMGRNCSENASKENKQWTFAIKDIERRPQIKLKTDQMKFYAEEISAMIIGEIKKIADSQHVTPFEQVVIAVPAQFNNAQRKATQNAGTIAGFKEVLLINETTAVALTYETNRQNDAGQTILVFDLGAGCFDVSVCKVTKKSVCVLATRGDPSFGGDDFDNRMMRHFADLIKEKHDKDIYQDLREQSRLRAECEKAKIHLSESAIAEIRVEFHSENFEVKFKITRDEFNERNKDFFEKIEATVRGVVDDAKTSYDKIDEVVVVGGSFRIFKVDEFLRNTFKNVNRTLNTDEAIAIGASIYAERVQQVHQIKAGLRTSKSSKSKATTAITDVVSRSIYVVDKNGKPRKIIKRNEQVPRDESLKKSLNDIFKRVKPGSKSEVLEKTGNNEENYLGTFLVSNGANITLEVDSNGIFRVKNCGKEVGKQIYDTTGSDDSTPEKLRKMAENINKVVKKYSELTERNQAKNDFERAIYKMKDMSRTSQHKERTKLILLRCDQELKWLESSKNATAIEYGKKKEELEKFTGEFMFVSTPPNNQVAEERLRRKARHDLQSLIFEITKMVPEESDIHRECLRIENAIESNEISTRIDYESCHHNLETNWKKSKPTTEGPEPMKNSTEIGEMMWEIVDIAVRYEIPQTTVLPLLRAYRSVLTWITGNSKLIPVKNIEEFNELLVEIESSAMRHQLPQQQRDELVRSQKDMLSRLNENLAQKESRKQNKKDAA